MKIKYEFVTDEIVEIEVPYDIGEVSIAIDRDIFNSNRKETRRYKSDIDDFDKYAFLMDMNSDVSFEVEKRFDIKKINNAIQNLQSQQREIIKKIFLEEKSTIEISKEFGITKQACAKRLKKIYKKLKKYLI